MLTERGEHDAVCSTVFFFNDTATTEIYTLSLHDALPILDERPNLIDLEPAAGQVAEHPVLILAAHAPEIDQELGDRKSTRLNSSHANISYAVFCLKKKKNQRPS